MDDKIYYFKSVRILFFFSSQYHVFELTRQLPRFSLYALCKPEIPEPKSHVSFQVNDRVQRVSFCVS